MRDSRLPIGDFGVLGVCGADINRDPDGGLSSEKDDGQ